MAAPLAAMACIKIKEVLQLVTPLAAAAPRLGITGTEKARTLFDKPIQALGPPIFDVSSNLVNTKL